MGIYDKLLAVQSKLKAPKGQYNSFGKYSYRSCEDIVEAVKPLLAEHKLVLTLEDDILMVGDRVYVKATASLHDTEDYGFVNTTAYAREEKEKKGMDASQVTGAASSYARKYALNGLFAIDDTKDSDATNDHGKTVGEPKKEEEFFCEECNTRIGSYKGKQGKMISPAAHAKASRGQFDKVLCLNCINKAMGNE